MLAHNGALLTLEKTLLAEKQVKPFSTINAWISLRGGVENP